jgi:hypothetical protein
VSRYVAASRRAGARWAAGGHWPPVCNTLQQRRDGSRDLRDAAAENEIRNTEDVMPKAKGRKAAAKHLHKGKKLEATKPLRVATKGGGKQEFMTVKMNEVLVSNYNS